MTQSDTEMFDLLGLWAWEYDADFIALLTKACEVRGVHAHFLDADNFVSIAAKLDSGEIKARAGLDRVWDWGGDYEAHVDAMRRHVPLMLNDYDKVRRAWNKVSMHMILINHGLYAPYLMLVPSVEEMAEVPVFDLSPLGDNRHT